MTYLLMILSGLLGIFGIVLDTHKEVKHNGKKAKVIRPWGVVTVAALVCILALSLYKQYRDEKEAAAIAVENDYLKLSATTVGPYYHFRLKFRDSLFNGFNSTYMHELRRAKQKEKDWYNALDSARRAAVPLATLLSPYDNGFLDSSARVLLFGDTAYSAGQPGNRARIEISAGILTGYVEFYPNGLTVPAFNIRERIREVITRQRPEGMDTIESRFFSYKDELLVSGKFSREARGSTIYGAVLNDWEAHRSSSRLMIYFDREPSVTDVKKIDRFFKRLTDIRFEISYDPDAIRWLIIPFELSCDYKLTMITEYGRKRWLFTKQLGYKKLPYIGNVSR